MSPAVAQRSAVLRTPDQRFANLSDYPFEPHYTIVDGLRIHHVEAGPRRAAPVLMMHGEPTWSFLYRHMIPIIANAGYRAIAPDLVGFGRSDKLARQQDYSYAQHVSWMTQWLDANRLNNITLVCQDWGSLIGLRLVAARPKRFSRVVVANGALPTGQGRAPLAFKLWQQFARLVPRLPVGRIVSFGCRHSLSPKARAAYDAPFPNESYKAAARAFPKLVPLQPDDPGAIDNRAAWEVLRRWDKPFLTAFSDGDPITRGGDRLFQRRVPGAKGQAHTVIRGGGHFLQEDAGPELAQVVVDFIKRSR
jgi:haloalkane dehalogenase